MGWTTFGEAGQLRAGTWAAAAAVAVMAMVVLAPSASAAQTIGAIVTPDTSCNADDTVVQATSPSNQYRAPNAGVITSWSYRSGPAAGTLKFKVVRPTSTAFEYTTVGDSAIQTALANQVNTFPTQISVQGGDIIGVYLQSDGLYCVDLIGAGSQYVGDFYNGDAQGTQTYAPAFNGQMPLSATLEPDCDGDGAGDETQDADTASCTPQPEPEPPASDTAPPETQISAGPEGKTKKKTATFSFSGTDARAVASFQCKLDSGSFETCTSPKAYSGLKKGTHTFSVRAVDAAGNVDPTPATRTWKVKKKRRKR